MPSPRREDHDGPKARVGEPTGSRHHAQDERGHGAGDATKQEPSFPLAANGGADNRSHHGAYEDKRHRRYHGIRKEVVEANRAPLLEEHRHPERRQRIHEERQQRDAVVESRILAKRGDDTDQHTEHNGRHGREADELDGLTHRVTEHRGDGLASLVIVA